MSGWQPIETAPRDGTIVLVHPATWTGMSASPARWDDNRYAKHPRPYWNRIDTVSAHISRAYEPTHWQPLPEPPSEEFSEKSE